MFIRFCLCIMYKDPTYVYIGLSVSLHMFIWVCPYIRTIHTCYKGRYCVRTCHR